MCSPFSGTNSHRFEPSIARLLEARAADHAEAVALLAPGRAPLTYGSLSRYVSNAHRALNAAGLGRNDRVALIVPSAPDMVAAFVAVAASAACAPLNPAYRAGEYAFYLSSLGAKALIVQSGIDTPARIAAQRSGIPVLELSPNLSEAEGFALRGESDYGRFDCEFGQSGDLALALHTSGTTGRPKLVSLTHANLCASARTIAATLHLGPDDRCLNILPLYHIHGLIGAVLSTLAAGATLVCPAGFNAPDFYGWLEEFRPSWFSAVPAIHQAILAQAAARPSGATRGPLRFIRSCSAPLPPRMMAELERVFNVPVIEAYGMTEASHQICSNPLPPGLRKAGSVGVATGCEVAVVDDAGAPLGPGEVGEIVVRGPNVTAGCVGESAPGSAARAGGWLRTGDQGRLDPDGYLFITGRLKEIINLGGTKISPREIEDILLDHPAVEQAVVFGIPDTTLGEDVAAVVVLRSGMAATEPALRQFAAQRLTDFKIPHRIAVVPEIPRSPTGKVRRHDLNDHFRTVLATHSTAPGDGLETTLARIWAEELQIDRVGVRDNFFELGGNSLKAVRTCARVQTTTGLPLSVAALYATPTVAQLARVLQRNGATGSPRSSLVPIRAGGSRPPLFCLHGAWGYVNDYIPLALRLPPDQPVYGLQARGIDGTQSPHARIEDMAAHCVQEIRASFPQGPYLVCGYSSAGVLAWEVALQLLAQGQRVPLLTLLDVNLYANPVLPPERSPLLPALRRRFRLHVEALRERSPSEQAAYVIQRLSRRAAGVSNGDRRPHPSEQTVDMPESPAGRAVFQKYGEARSAYLPRPYRGRIALILVRQPAVNLRYDPRLPGRLAIGSVEIHEVRGDHGSFLKEPRVRVLAEKVQACIAKAD